MLTPDPEVLQQNFAPFRKEVATIAALARNVTKTSEVPGFVGSGCTSIAVRLQGDPRLLVRVPNQTADTDYGSEELIAFSNERLEALQRGFGQRALEQIHGYGPDPFMEGFHNIVTTYEAGQDFTKVVESTPTVVEQSDMDDFVKTLAVMDSLGLTVDTGLHNLIFNPQLRKGRLVVVDYLLKHQGEGLRDSTWRFTHDLLTQGIKTKDKRESAAVVDLSNRFRTAVHRNLGQEYAQLCPTIEECQ